MIINIDKPVGWTSFDIVKKVKRITGHKKVGHGGTLDPFASGVLILGTENDTKNLSEITRYSKSYQAELTLGVKTNTLDPEGKIIEIKPIPFLNDHILSIEVNEKFIGERGRINCSLRDPSGYWRWLGIQFVVGEK